MMSLYADWIQIYRKLFVWQNRVADSSVWCRTGGVAPLMESQQRKSIGWILNSDIETKRDSSLKEKLASAKIQWTVWHASMCVCVCVRHTWTNTTFWSYITTEMTIFRANGAFRSSSFSLQSMFTLQENRHKPLYLKRNKVYEISIQYCS